VGTDALMPNSVNTDEEDDAPKIAAQEERPDVAVPNDPKRINLPKMAHVDVVILSTDETRSRGGGINILDGLNPTLSGTLFGYELYSGTYSNSTTTIINPSFNLLNLEYNLNIFNDGVNKEEVLASPSLLATENATSHFFPGENSMSSFPAITPTAP